MSKCRRQPILMDARAVRRAAALTRRVMWLKRGIPLALLALWTLALLLIIGLKGSPADWQTETVQYSQMEQRQVKRWSRHGSATQRVDVLIAVDGRAFRLEDGMQFQSQLTAGEACTIIYEPAPGQAMHVRALSTAEDGELLPLAESIAAHAQVVRLLWWTLVIGAALCLTALWLVEVCWLKPERMLLARLTQRNPQ